VPKLRLELVCDDDDSEQLIEAIAAAARTGRIGDGKIWSMAVETLVRVRTGERGTAAI
jgi:nitrogen regulatory protein P-II 1